MNIQLKNVKKDYRDKRVLDIDKLSISKGKITGIIGPNGAGKTTLMNIIAGLDDNFLGEVRYDGKKLDKNVYKKMTLVKQKPYLFKRSVYENIAYPLKVRGYKKEDIEDRVKKMIDKFEIEELEEKKANRLSGGESQKVSLARGLVFEPNLLLLDEPTSNIDPESIRIMEKEIVDFNKDKDATVVMITHNMDQAKRICEKVIFLDEGEVIEDGVF